MDSNNSNNKVDNEDHAKDMKNKKTVKKVAYVNNKPKTRKQPKRSAFVKNKTNSNKQIDKQIDDKISKIVLSDKPQKPKENSLYYQALLFPEGTMTARVPGMADACIPLHRKLSYTVTTNALGAATIFTLPITLSDSTAALSTTYVNNGSGFDGMTSFGSGGTGAVFITQNITAGSVGQYRLVSASMCVLPQSSVLNQSGSIHGAMMKIPGSPPVPVAGAYPGIPSFELIPNMECTPFYGVASVSAGEGIRIIWMPNDLCELDFTNINTNQFSNDPQAQANAMIATIVGAAPSAPFRVDIYQNFEVSAPAGSVLVGMETIAKENTQPTLVWREILTKHSHDVVISSKSIASVARYANNRSFERIADAPGLENRTILPNNQLQTALEYVRSVRP